FGYAGFQDRSHQPLGHLSGYYSFTTVFNGPGWIATRYFVPSGYTSILLASPVFRRAMALEKSFIGMRSVITGCRSRRPLFSKAVIWYQVWYMRRPLMP